MANVYVINKFQSNPYPNAIEVDTTSRGAFKDLSPFYLGPVFDPFTKEKCLVFENYWQYSKVYHNHINMSGDVTKLYWHWRKLGFSNTRANRHPVAKGKKPLGSLYGNRLLPYIDARRLIYIPMYAELVKATHSYAMLYQWHCVEGRDIVLRDFDGYDYHKFNMSLVDVVNEPKRIQGHAFIIAGMLTGWLERMVKENV